ncbi:MAG: RsmD family RNA methyltransferase, partial [Puniceicoccales bacterium]|nr:RsmD family RNA methyltransferase [Puniceicoccales bacterium]
MRIMGGLARGIVLKSIIGERLRPATGYLREAIFSVLGKSVEGSYFLDLFAGTGSYGLEALSRGARQGIFVEYDSRCLAILKENLINVCKNIEMPTNCYLWNMDALKVKTKERFDIIFIDPPYDYAREKKRELLTFGANLLRESGQSRLIFVIPQDIIFEMGTDLYCLDIRMLRRRG